MNAAPESQLHLFGKVFVAFAAGGVLGVPLAFSGPGFFLLLILLLAISGLLIGLRSLPIRALLFTWTLGIGLASGLTAALFLTEPSPSNLPNFFALILAFSGFAGTYAAFVSLIRLGLFSAHDKPRAHQGIQKI